MRRGLFITFEGCDGSGKSTQIKLLEKTLVEKGHDVLVLREPGGSRVGEKIRRVLLDASNSEITPVTELLLYEAARSQMVSEIVLPALEKGAIVLCDRFFDSTTAYQGFGRGLNLNMIDKLNLLVSHSAVPDKTLYIDIDATHGHSRATRRSVDRLEAEGVSFQEKVREGFLYAASEHPNRIAVIDGAHPREEVARSIRSALEPLGLFENSRGEE